jgi:CheY-like chemotaxis protein
VRAKARHPGQAQIAVSSSDDEGQAVAKIVAADDNDAIQDVVTRVLHRAGHDVTMCQDGGELVDEVRHRHPEVVVTDNQMPVMTGLQARETLLEDPDTADIPVVLASANLTEADTRHVLVDGDQQVPKPFTAGELNHGVDAALQHAHSHHAPTPPPANDGTPQPSTPGR